MNIPDPLPRWQGGDIPSAEDFNKVAAAAESANALSATEGSGLLVSGTTTGLQIDRRPPAELWAKITGGGTDGEYEATQQIEDAAGAWVDGPREWDSANPLIELNRDTSVADDTIVRAWKAGYFWRFQKGPCS